MNCVIREIYSILREIIFANRWNLNLSLEFIFANSSKKEGEENLSQTSE